MVPPAALQLIVCTVVLACTNSYSPCDLREGARPLQAGNKSALTYRCDIGVPGYTGYIPQSAAVPLQVKGSTKHTGDFCCSDLLPTVACREIARVSSSTDLSTDCDRSSHAGRMPTITHQQEAATDVPDFHTASW